MHSLSKLVKYTKSKKPMLCTPSSSWASLAVTPPVAASTLLWRASVPMATLEDADAVADDEDSADADLERRYRGLRFDDDDEDMPDDYDPEQAQTFVDYNFVADYGFDPLRLSRVDLHLGAVRGADEPRPLQAVLRDYREAELRHGRLAMLAAVAWPVQELLSPVLSRALSEPQLLAETAGRTPSVLNGGLEQSTIPLTLGVGAALVAAVDVYALQLRAVRGDDWLPGDFDFDPLRILRGASLAQRRRVQAAEIDNGRLAMLAVIVMAAEEAITGQPVTQLTPWLFEPAFLLPEVQRALDSEFAAAAFRPS